MANIKAKGIIIKQSDYGEGHRMLTIFTAGYGILKAISYGAVKSKSATAASSQMLTYGTFTLFSGNSKLMSVTGIDAEESFYPVYEDIEKLALINYLSDITFGLLGENNPDDNILKLYLNTVYALCYKNESLNKIKTVFEFKLMSLGGYMPQTELCVNCKADTICAFDLEKGGVVCNNCKSKSTVKINHTILQAIKHIINSDIKKMFLFEITDEMTEYLNRISESYISVQLDKTFQSLTYFKTILMS